MSQHKRSQAFWKLVVLYSYKARQVRQMSSFRYLSSHLKKMKAEFLKIFT